MGPDFSNINNKRLSAFYKVPNKGNLVKYVPNKSMAAVLNTNKPVIEFRMPRIPEKILNLLEKIDPAIAIKPLNPLTVKPDPTIKTTMQMAFETAYSRNRTFPRVQSILVGHAHGTEGEFDLTTKGSQMSGALMHFALLGEDPHSNISTNILEKIDRFESRAKSITESFRDFTGVVEKRKEGNPNIARKWEAKLAEIKGQFEALELEMKKLSTQGLPEQYTLALDKVALISGLMEEALADMRGKLPRVHTKINNVLRTALTELLYALRKNKANKHLIKGLKKIDLKLEPELILPQNHVFANAKLKRVFYNIVYNAINELTKSGSLMKQVKINAFISWDKKKIVIQISDSGPGFKEEDLAHVFELGFTRSGSGKGLFIAKQIVEDHGGTMRAGNSEGGGAMLTVELPISPLS